MVMRAVEDVEGWVWRSGWGWWCWGVGWCRRREARQGIEGVGGIDGGEIEAMEDIQVEWPAVVVKKEAAAASLVRVVRVAVGADSAATVEETARSHAGHVVAVMPQQATRLLAMGWWYSPWTAVITDSVGGIQECRWFFSRKEGL